MESIKNKTFKVYFEVFGIKMKYTVNNSFIKTQEEAEDYVKYILIPSQTKFYKPESVNSTQPGQEQKEQTVQEDKTVKIDEFIESLSKKFNEFVNKLKL